MRYRSYDEYLQSQEWRAKALKRAEIDNHRCQMCGCTGTMTNRIQIHHISYRNLYAEDVDKDLVCLCDVCHRNVHRMMCRITDSSTGQRGWRDTLPPSQHHVIDLDGTGTQIEIVADNREEGNQ